MSWIKLSFDRFYTKLDLNNFVFVFAMECYRLLWMENRKIHWNHLKIKFWRRNKDMNKGPLILFFKLNNDNLHTYFMNTKLDFFFGYETIRKRDLCNIVKIFELLFVLRVCHRNLFMHIIVLVQYGFLKLIKLMIVKWILTQMGVLIHLFNPFIILSLIYLSA